MKLTGLLEEIKTDPAAVQAAQSINEGVTATVVAPTGVRASLAALAAAHSRARKQVIITATGREAEQLAAALRCYTDGVAVLPSWETLPHERLSPQADTMAQRVAVMRRLTHPEPRGRAGAIQILVVPLRAFLQPIIGGLGELEPLRVHEGNIVDLDHLVEQLKNLGYETTDMVRSRGQMAVRGGILDVFAPIDPHPIRVELFGDEVDDIRYFSVSDQRAVGKAPDGLWAPAARELLLTPKVKERAAKLVGQLPGSEETLELIAQGIAVQGMESLSPVLVDQMVTLLDLVDSNTTVVLSDPERIAARSEDLVATTEEFLSAAWSAAAAGGDIPVQAGAASFKTLEEMHTQADDQQLGWVQLTALPPAALAGAIQNQVETQQSDGQHGPIVVSKHLMQVGARAVVPYRGNIEAATKDLADLEQQGWRLVLTTAGPGPAKRLRDVLADKDVAARLVDAIPQAVEPGVVHVLAASAHVGFVLEQHRLAVITESDLTGRSGPSTADMRKMPSRRKRGLDPLTLKKGDFVVHEHHGIGRFIEMVSRTMGSGKQAVTRDYLLIEYAPTRRGQPGDRLYVPTDQLDQVSKYSGSDAPSLSKMGGAEWAKTKARARKAVREIAGELVRLYAARQATKGHAFSPDTPWQRELEDAFEHVETPDQLVTIDEVKSDMEKPVPMDRLLCGDVGYGKTEIAVRAAFKAVMDGKQVAVLVPTTLLVQQHMETFTQRYAGFPIEVASLSRFSTRKESQEVQQRLLDGQIDIVIGTHSLLTGAVRFKDLGLVIIDEEQRFGVEHKETLKQLRTNADVLSMSATPIPRTLEMAVTGLREMSLLQTPPEDRHPILTFVGAYTDQQVSAAIKRELLRDGQVFYVHNRVNDIDKVAAHLQELVPQARVRVAHGKLSESQLEAVIVDFWNREFDVLVCTTIVETGLDISNANTLIVDRADAMGLSQLHQLRGRVGRGRERAYAYFLYPGDKALTETAHERLSTIAANTDLGAGLAVAQKDLEIRGAGNLLGGEQSGHIAGVGFDLYVRMVADAVTAFRGGEEEKREDCRIELPIDAHIPVEYIKGEQLRLETYAKIAALTSAQDAADVRDELTDRYGPIPEQVQLLFALSGLRAHARAEGIEEVVAQGKYIRFASAELSDSAAMRLKRLYPGAIQKAAVRQVLVPAPTTSRIGGNPLVDQELIDWVDQFIDSIVAYKPAQSH
ncbi:transcription-repair coupling factor [Gleimia hominis]|uniref:transcription-repair coupling factor n=1 Tax=Gleimia hominis TaxID=595468 RepID=UPI000C805CCC|nr:transcription-repair coupling factor [Gleimia hominis]WIK63734.1 transcription-repair coupling factor [Gleimia hominis]